MKPAQDLPRYSYIYFALLLALSFVLCFPKPVRFLGSGPSMCPRRYNKPAYYAKSDIDMIQVYDTIPFDNFTLQPSGWKEGFPVTYNVEETLHEKRLEVVVIPFSHNDPGWLKTFEEYYQRKTDDILSNAQSFLNSQEEMRFVWSEICFLELWWRRHDQNDRWKMNRAIHNGQMEILTGGWVMTDEANTHYYSTIMELMEGHEWIMNHLNVTPEVHWSIDPFGLSPTMAYLIKTTGLKHMLIQRTHYAVKRYLAERRQLEFRWRQIWAGSEEKTDIFTHMMPFDSYDLGVSCGPDRQVCKEFDFANFYRIDEKNVAQKAKTLADQYWKKAQLYTNNVILVPQGSDFRYEDRSEFKNQYENLDRLFTHINENEKRYNMHVQFGTLKDYFRLTDDRISENMTHVLSLSGDFFVYADRYDNYWSGYFTSRPFHKYMDRTLQHFLRSADILFSFANQKVKAMQSNNGKDGKENSEDNLSSIYGHLVQARRSLSLFQHHDGITGTSKKYVMEDYAKKLSFAINSTKFVIESAAAYLLGASPKMLSLEKEHILTMDEEHFSDKISRKRLVRSGSTLVLFNPLTFERKEVTCILVAGERSKILEFSNNDVPSTAPLQQVHPVFEMKANRLFAMSNFELCFLAQIPALGFRKYFLKLAGADEPDPMEKIQMSFKGDVDFGSLCTRISSVPRHRTQNISNGILSVSFNPQSGFLQDLKSVRSGKSRKLKLSFMQYGVRSSNRSVPEYDSQSGAYLFLPDGDARPLSNKSTSQFVIIRGPVRNSVVVKPSGALPILHAVDLDIGSDSLQIRNLVDIGNLEWWKSDFELIMRMEFKDAKKHQLTDFYTDLNGFQMIHRKRFKRLPIQAHFYPMPASAILQNRYERITLLGRQPLGVASLKPSQIEVVLDRRLVNDDQRGLGEGVMDNRLTESRFRLMFEHITADFTTDPRKVRYSSISQSATETAFLSMAANQNSIKLNHPLVTLKTGENVARSGDGKQEQSVGKEQKIPTSLSLINGSLQCDVHIIAFRTLSQPTAYPPGGDPSKSSQYPAPTQYRPSAALVLHRFGVECDIQPVSRQNFYSCFTVSGDTNVEVRSIFRIPPAKVRNATLTLLKVVEEKENGPTNIEPMEIRTWKIDF